MGKTPRQTISVKCIINNVLRNITEESSAFAWAKIQARPSGELHNSIMQKVNRLTFTFAEKKQIISENNVTKLHLISAPMKREVLSILDLIR